MCVPGPHRQHRHVKKRSRGSIPWGTHLVGSLLFVAWMVGGTASSYGIDWTYTEWWPWTDTDPGLLGILAFICFVLAPAIAFIEAGLARLPSAWPARVVVLAYVFHIGLFSALPFGFRLAGDDSPGDGTDAVMFLQAFVLFVGAQLAAALGAARLLAAPGVRAVAGSTRHALTETRPPEAAVDALRRAHERVYGPRARRTTSDRGRGTRGSN
jgi:hypothetical protein